MASIFFRELSEDDKGAALAEDVAAVRDGSASERTFAVEPDSFSQVSESPFAYWVSERIRRLFTELSPFESEGRTVRVGVQTSDDFRFLRTWWEVPPEKILDAANGPDWREDIEAFQEWCRQRTFEGKKWAPFAKGGEYSPYYADIHLVVNWEQDGREIRQFQGSYIRNENHYFRPGAFQTLRADRLAPHLTPAGCIFGHNGFQAFSILPHLQGVLGALNSSCLESLYQMQVGREGYALYVAGTLQRTPFPRGPLDDSAVGARNAVQLKLRFAQSDCTSGLFQRPLLLTAERSLNFLDRMEHLESELETATDQLHTIQKRVDRKTAKAYGLSADEHRHLVMALRAKKGERSVGEQTAVVNYSTETSALVTRPSPKRCAAGI